MIGISQLIVIVAATITPANCQYGQKIIVRISVAIVIGITENVRLHSHGSVASRYFRDTPTAAREAQQCQHYDYQCFFHGRFPTEKLIIKNFLSNRYIR